MVRWPNRNFNIYCLTRSEDMPGKRDSSVIVGAGPGPGPGPSEETMEPEPLACFCCQSTSDAFLSCGHVCCVRCIEQLGANYPHIRCGVCRKKNMRVRRIRLPKPFDLTCSLCHRNKDWVANCNHVICTCSCTRCTICNTTITCIRKIFM